MCTSSRPRTHLRGFLDPTGRTIEQVARTLAATPELSRAVVGLQLQETSGNQCINDGESLSAILSSCSNVECLHFRVTRAALEGLAASPLCLDRLHNLRIECHDPDPDVLARFLENAPCIRTLSLGILGPGVAMKGEHADLQLRRFDVALLQRLVSYSQTTFQAVYFWPMVAAARSLRFLSVFVKDSLPDLSYLTELTRVHLKITGRGPRPMRDASFAGFLGCRRLRHIDITCIDNADESLFGAIAALGPRLLSLGVHIIGDTRGIGETLTTHLVKLVRGPLARLRTLCVRVDFVHEEGMQQMRDALYAACRHRRVQLLLESFLY